MDSNKGEGRRKREEGRSEEGRRKKEEGKGKREGRGKREEGRRKLPSSPVSSLQFPLDISKNYCRVALACL